MSSLHGFHCHLSIISTQYGMRCTWTVGGEFGSSCTSSSIDGLNLLCHKKRKQRLLSLKFDCRNVYVILSGKKTPRRYISQTISHYYITNSNSVYICNFRKISRLIMAHWTCRLISCALHGQSMVAPPRDCVSLYRCQVAEGRRRSIPNPSHELFCPRLPTTPTCVSVLWPSRLARW